LVKIEECERQQPIEPELSFYFPSDDSIAPVATAVIFFLFVPEP
jgi:hypothetical protein